MTPKRNQQALMEFMMGKLGGKDSVMREFYGSRMAELADRGATLGDLLKEAADEGWQDQLHEMPLTDLSSAIRRESEPDDDAAGGGRRLSKADKAVLQDRILAHLGEQPWSAKVVIAEAVGFPASKLGPQLRNLKGDGKIKSVGEKGGTRYALVSERSKPRD